MKKITLGIYQHYKGKYYQVLGTARHSETLEELIVYKALYRSEFGLNSFWVRPRKMFQQKVKVDGKSVPRFRYIGRKKPS